MIKMRPKPVVLPVMLALPVRITVGWAKAKPELAMPPPWPADKFGLAQPGRVGRWSPWLR